MAKIRILPDIMANKIAAGEVVERPSSVVKELLENAIDAESTRIHIDIEQGGRNLIRISDNGIGMNGDDALISLERHATSKIHEARDLFAINTLGFRGEALPSIASVSRFTLTTKDRESESGAQIIVEGGKIKDVRACGAPQGTMISVQQLFYNIPARRKFLKSIQTETGHILDVVSSLALGWPQIQFSLNHNGKPVKTWSQANDPYQRVVDILGNDTKGHLHALTGQSGDMTVNGWIASPRIHRSTSQKIYLFVNNRHIRDRGLYHALFEGYRERLVKGRFPLAVLFFSLPPDKVDVNVHPTKHEVRFVEKHIIYQALKATVAQVLSDGERPKWGGGTGITPSEPPAPDTPLPRAPRPSPSFPGRPTAAPASPMKDLPPRRSPVTYPDITEGDVEIPRPAVKETPPLAYPPRIQTVNEKKSAPQAPKESSLWQESFFQSLRIIGQFRNSYIICENESGLILIDQHAAHERIYYETLKHKARKTKPPVQTLLVPETLEVGYREAVLLEKLIPQLDACGLNVEPFGDNTFIIKSVPAILADREVAPIIIEMVENILEENLSRTIEEQMDKCLVIMACHSVIRARQSLTHQEIKGLLEQLDQCENPSHCPHGRPTWIEWDRKEMEKQFSRIV